MRTLLIVDDEFLIADGLRGILADAFAGRLNVICRWFRRQTGFSPHRFREK